MEDTGEVVIISLIEYNRLRADSEWLDCLKAAGVDNWSGYDHAISLRADADEEEEL
jgi:hypothetical protein